MSTPVRFRTKARDNEGIHSFLTSQSLAMGLFPFHGGT